MDVYVILYNCVFKFYNLFNIDTVYFIYLLFTNFIYSVHVYLLYYWWTRRQQSSTILYDKLARPWAGPAQPARSKLNRTQMNLSKLRGCGMREKFN